MQVAIGYHRTPVEHTMRWTVQSTIRRRNRLHHMFSRRAQLKRLTLVDRHQRLQPFLTIGRAYLRAVVHLVETSFLN